VTGMTSNALAT